LVHLINLKVKQMDVAIAGCPFEVFENIGPWSGTF
jgi:hypothetical protein